MSQRARDAAVAVEHLVIPEKSDPPPVAVDKLLRVALAVRFTLRHADSGSMIHVAVALLTVSTTLLVLGLVSWWLPSKPDVDLMFVMGSVLAVSTSLICVAVVVRQRL